LCVREGAALGGRGLRLFLCLAGDESIMSQKDHGTSPRPPPEVMRWGCNRSRADSICCYNRHYTEYSGYWLRTSFLRKASFGFGPVVFYDTVGPLLALLAGTFIIGPRAFGVLRRSLLHPFPRLYSSHLIPYPSPSLLASLLFPSPDHGQTSVSRSEGSVVVGFYR